MNRTTIVQEQEIIAYLENRATTDAVKKIENWIMASGENARKFNLLKAKHIASTYDKTAAIDRTDKGYADFMSTVKSSSKFTNTTLILKCAAMIVAGFWARISIYKCVK